MLATSSRLQIPATLWSTNLSPSTSASSNCETMSSRGFAALRDQFQEKLADDAAVLIRNSAVSAQARRRVSRHKLIHTRLVDTNDTRNDARRNLLRVLSAASQLPRSMNLSISALHLCRVFTLQRGLRREERQNKTPIRQVLWRVGCDRRVLRAISLQFLDQLLRSSGVGGTTAGARDESSGTIRTIAWTSSWLAAMTTPARRMRNWTALAVHPRPAQGRAQAGSKMS